MKNKISNEKQNFIRYQLTQLEKKIKIITQDKSSHQGSCLIRSALKLEAKAQR
jgi:hypothetical protein